MPFPRIALLTVFLVALPYPPTVSAKDAAAPAIHVSENPLVGTWRGSDTVPSGPTRVSFVTFRQDGSYQVRVYDARLAGHVNGAHVITGTYEITADRFVFRPREAFSCPAGSNCVPLPLTTEFFQPQSGTFRLLAADRLVDGEGVVWRRVRR